MGDIIPTGPQTIVARSSDLLPITLGNASMAGTRCIPWRKPRTCWEEVCDISVHITMGLSRTDMYSPYRLRPAARQSLTVNCQLKSAQSFHRPRHNLLLIQQPQLTFQVRSTHIPIPSTTQPSYCLPFQLRARQHHHQDLQTWLPQRSSRLLSSVAHQLPLSPQAQPHLLC